jgi:hypothetical protein
MSYARQMLDTFSRTVDVDADLLAAAIDAMSDCQSRADQPVPSSPSRSSSCWALTWA